MNKVEHWKQVPGEPLLEASSFGRVRRLDRVMAVTGRTEKGHSVGNFRPVTKGGVMRPWLQSTGYLVVSFMVAGKTYKRAVHRVVARAFVLGYFDGATVDHIDGDRLNNAPENLAWVTLAENTRRQNADGRGVPKGEKHPGAKLRDSDVPELFRLRSEGHSLAAIGAIFGVSGSLVHKITSGARRASK